MRTHTRIMIRLILISLLAVAVVRCNSISTQEETVGIRILIHGYVERGFELVTLDMKTGSRTSLTNRRLITPTSFSFDRERSRVVFSAYAENGEELFLITPETEPWIVLTTGGNKYSNPRWSPDGKLITFNSRLSDHFIEVMLVDEKGENMRRLISDIGISARDPQWSISGELISVLILDPESVNQDEAIAIGVVDVRTGEIINNINGSVGIFKSLPSWSPKKPQLVFALYDGGSLDLNLYDFVSGKLDVLADSDADEWFGVWSPDGARLAYLRSHKERGASSNLIILDLNTMMHTPILDENLAINSLLWADNSSILIGIYDDIGDKTEFYIFDLLENALHEVGNWQGMYFQPVLLP